MALLYALCMGLLIGVVLVAGYVVFGLIVCAFPKLRKAYRKFERSCRR